MTQVAQIWELVEPYLAAERLELDDLELTGAGRGRTLRVTVDGENVNIDRLARLSRGIARMLDNEIDLRDQYQLEVSSPGLERKLKRPAHYEKSIGREVVVKVREGDGAVTHRGVLSAANERSFAVGTSESAVVIDYNDVISAKTIFKWEKAPKPGH